MQDALDRAPALPSGWLLGARRHERGWLAASLRFEFYAPLCGAAAEAATHAVLAARRPLPTAAMFGELSHDWENITRNEIIAYMKSLRPTMPHFDLLGARHHVLLDQPLAFASSIKQQMENWLAQGAFD